MAGTDRRRASRTGGPAVILVEPQLGENIGTAARAMLNFGLTDLRLVRPRDGWPSEKARAASSGATRVIDEARLFETVEDALGGLGFVGAATARRRDMVKPVFTPRAAAHAFRTRHAAGIGTGLLFGRERWGLTNDEVTLADAVVQIPANPAYMSLNLAMAVLLLGYEWYQSSDSEIPAAAPEDAPADKAELLGFFRHLERELDASGFLRVVEKRPAMVRNIRNLFQRAGLTSQEVRTLRGVVAYLTKGRGGT